MLKRFAWALVFLAGAVNASEIGVIDLEAVLSASEKAADARASWEVELAPKEAALARLLEQGQTLEAQFNQNDPQGADRRQAIDDMNAIRAEIADIQQQAQTLIAQREQEFLATQLPIIESLVIELAQAKDLDLVIDASAVIWGTPKVNLSDDLLARFNAAQ